MASEHASGQLEEVESQVQDLNRRAAELGNRKEYEEAIKLAQRSRDLALEHLDKNDLNFVVSVDHLARFSRSLSRFHDAIAFYTEALERLHELGVLDPTTPAEPITQFVRTLANRGDLYRLIGKYRDAESDLNQALRICEGHGLNQSVLNLTLNNLAVLHKAKGEYREAERLYNQLLRVQRETQPKGDKVLAQTLSNLAALYHAMGRYRYTDAENLYNEALKIRRELPGDVDPAVGLTLNGLAGVLESKGDYRRADAFYQQARDLLRGQTADYAAATDNLAGLCQKMGDYRKAEELFLETQKIRRDSVGKTSPTYAFTLDNLAGLYYSVGRISEAEDLQQEATEIFLALPDGHPDLAINLSNRATTLCAAGRYKEAEPLLERAIQIYRAAGRERDHDLGAALNNMGNLHHGMGNYGAAEQNLSEAREVQRKAVGEKHPSYGSVLINLVKVYAVTDRALESLPLLLEASAIDDGMAQQLLALGSERQQLAYLATLRDHFDGFLSLVLGLLPDSRLAVGAAIELVLRRKGLAAQVSALQRELALASRYPELKKTLEILFSKRASLAEKTISGPKDLDPTEYRRELDQLNDEKERLEADLSRQIPEVAYEQGLKSVSARSVVGQSDFHIVRSATVP